MITRRHVFKLGGIVGASALLTFDAPRLMSAAARLLAPTRTPDFTGTRLIAILSEGSGPEQLGVRAGVGTAPSGPQAIAALRDGTLAILDTLNSRITFLVNGRSSNAQQLPGAMYPLDLEVLGADLAVFDPSAATVFLIRAGRVASLRLPAVGLNAVSRITKMGDVPALVEEDFASYDTRFGRADLTDGYPDPRGGRLTVAYGDSDVSRRRSAQIRQGDGATFTIVTTHALGSVIALGRDDVGRSYFQVSELVPSEGGLDLDLTLRRFGIGGAPEGVARVPVRGRHSHPRRAVCFSPDGGAFALFPERDQVRVLQLEWSAAILPLVPLIATVALPRLSADAALLIANCRATAIAVGNDYAHLSSLGGSWIATSANLVERNGALRPVYLSGPGSYTNIPYCWGGMHVPQGFINNDERRLDGGQPQLQSAGICRPDLGGGLLRNDPAVLGRGGRHQAEYRVTHAVGCPKRSAKRRRDAEPGRHVAVANKPRAHAPLLPRWGWRRLHVRGDHGLGQHVLPHLPALV